VSLKTVEQPA